MRARRIVSAAAILLLAMGCARLARPALSQGSCPEPTIVAAHWMSLMNFSNFESQLSLEIGVDTHGQRGSATMEIYDSTGVLSDLGDAELKPSNQVQTADLKGDNGWWRNSPMEVVLNVRTSCGEAGKAFHTRGGRTGYFGRQDVFGCADYIIIDSRGSGEKKHFVSEPGALFASQFRHEHRGASLQLIDNTYPSPGGLLVLLEAGSKWPSSAYYKSVVTGKELLEVTLDELQQRCAASLVLITGYSQGAQVTGDVWQENHWDTLGGAIVFGDPYFNPRDKGAQGDFSHGYWGALGRRPADDYPNPYYRSYCHLHDPVCQGAIWYPHYRSVAHASYGELGEPQEAAKHFKSLYG